MKRILLVTIVVAMLVQPARAQIVVTDPGNLAQAILIAERTLREYETLWQQYKTILRMAHKHGNMDRYRVPPLAVNGHDPARWPDGAPGLQGLNAGDNPGVRYVH